MFYELSPAYGRDYKSAKDVIEAFNKGKDFVGDYNLDFRYCSKRDIPAGSTVMLRYKANRQVTSVKVKE